MTSSIKSSVVLFVSLAILTLALSGSPGKSAEIKLSGFEKWRVHVVNGLGGGRSLFVHCKSKDDDLGTHDLATGAEVNWSFNTNYFGTTLFWCYLRTNIEHASFEVFWVEKEHHWLAERCTFRNCIWIAKDDGVYLTNNPQHLDERIHNWELGI